MKPKTEEFLNLLLWTADQILHPTFRNLTESYESWSYRNFSRQTAALQKHGLLERVSSHPSNDRLYRLTEKGRLHALGGRDPEAQWRRSWDGIWRLVIFDLSTGNESIRQRLWRSLRSRAFGCLQKSVWISAYPMTEEKTILTGGKVDVGSLILFEAHPSAGESNADIVAKAWNFSRINQNYSNYLKVLDRIPASPRLDSAQAASLRRWSNAERLAWLQAVALDPLLPERLLPRGYLGKQAWRRRVETLRAVQQFSF